MSPLMDALDYAFLKAYMRLCDGSHMRSRSLLAKTRPLYCLCSAFTTPYAGPLSPLSGARLPTP